MKNLVIFVALLLCGSEVFSLNLPGPRVYVVTPATAKKTSEGRSAPFYYHNWMRRMDSPTNATTTTTTTPKTKTPDLIFAEFESDSKKNIRKLLENERITIKAPTTTTTTSRPTYVRDEIMEPPKSNYGLPLPTTEKIELAHFDDNKDNMEYFSVHNSFYNNEENLPAPVYLPSTTTTPKPTQKSTTTTQSTTTAPQLNEVQNIWQIIDNEKSNDHLGTWDEVQVSSDNEHSGDSGTKNYGNDNNGNVQINENFALPGFATNPVNGGENESRAIRTESDVHFPYVNLKPFQMKFSKQSNNDKSYSKKGNNMYTSLDNFQDLKKPVRGEAQDVVPLVQSQPIDRYNPAQPYLPNYGPKSQANPVSPPIKATANLVPPPPPPPPKPTGDDFPSPNSYELFPPYPPPPARPLPPSKPVSVYSPPMISDNMPSSGYDTFQAPPLPSPRKPTVMYQPPMDSGDDYSVPPMNDDGPADSGYQYKPPKPPASDFLPTLPPLKKPVGYSYDKPPMSVDEPPPMSDDDQPNFHGYNYDKPPTPDMPAFHGYHYDKPVASPPKDHSAPSYGPHPSPPYGHESDYPELIYNKPHGGMGDDSGAGDMKGGDDMGMMPPPAPANLKPDMDDHGFPSDFPDDFKYHDFYEHDHDYHHHHHPTTTTTTTTTEMPRVNRYSYYYLGKKLYYLPLYFSVYFIIYVGALIIKAVLRHKIVYPNSFRPNDQTSSFFTKRSVGSWDLSNEQLHEITGKVTHAIGTAAEKYLSKKEAKND